MVAAYVAGRLSQDPSRLLDGLQGEPEALADAIVAERAARLARVAETSAKAAGLPLPIYVIGTEVPPPGGATHEISTIEPTSPAAVKQTWEVHRAAFAAAGVEAALTRVIALVVQPGVEFGNANVVIYDPAPARALIGALDDLPGLVFEAHSTDYQPTEALKRTGRRWFCHPQGRPRPDLRAARGAIRARCHCRGTARAHTRTPCRRRWSG